MMGCFLCSGESARRKVISSSIENRPRLNDYEKLQLDTPKVTLPKSSKDPKASPPKYVKDFKASPSPPRSVKDNKTSPSPPKYVKDAKSSSPVAVKNTRPSPPKYVKDIRASPPNNTVRAPKPSLPKYAKDPKPIPTPPKYVKDLKAGKPKYVKENPQVVNQSGLSPCNGEPKPNVPGARTFPFDTLVSATQNFKAENFLGAGGFGEVYKGRLPDTGEIVAVKQLDRNGCQGIREFMVEVLTLSMAKHSNLVKLIGYCAEGDQRLLVYEFMPLGSLEDHLHGPRPSRKALDWNARMKIAAGAAQGLEYLHDKMTKPIIYRDLKCSNILLGEGYDPKLSDFGLAKVGPSGDETHVSTRVMGTYGYCAPDYAMTGQLTFKSDIYSFGVVLLEIITGRRAIDNRRSGHETNLVAWAKPLFKDRKKFHQMADPALEGRYPVRGLYQALAIAAMCVQEQPSMRPLIADVVTALNFLACQKYDPDTEPTQRSSGRSLHSLRSKSDGDLEHIAVTTDERTI